MTREEAIKELSVEYLGDSERIIKAKKMAIKTLEQEPCENCISREQAIEICKNHGHDNSAYYISKLPPVTPQPKTGHWIAQDIHNCHTDFKCSECGYIHSFMHLYGKPTADYTYCPNCGARMVEPQKVRKYDKRRSNYNQV